MIKEPDYSRFLIYFKDDAIPCLEIETQGKKILLEISFGSQFPLTLSKEVLSSLQKRKNGVLTVKDGEGGEVQFQSYLIPKIILGNRILTNVIAVEESALSKRKGTIGRSLLMQTNILLDFPRSTLIFCNDSKKLKKVGYYLKNMTPVSFDIIDRIGIILEVNTAIGKLKGSLGSDISCIRKSLIEEQKLSKSQITLPFPLDECVIGHTKLGTIPTHPLNLPQHLGKLDLLIGTKIFINHTVYFDFQNKVAYFEDN